MAVRISKDAGTYDRFKTTCPHCGAELEYSRKDIRSHVRWKDGFIYCPKCKNPVGHEESNLTKKGAEIAKTIPAEVAARYRQEIKVFKILRAVFIPVGLILLIVLTTVFAIVGGVKQQSEFMTYSIVSFIVGLNLLIAAGVFKSMIVNRQVVEMNDK